MATVQNKDGTISAYGLRVGYRQIYSVDINTSKLVILERSTSLGSYKLTVKTTRRIITDSFATIAEARERHNHWCKVLSANSELPSCP